MSEVSNGLPFFFFVINYPEFEIWSWIFSIQFFSQLGKYLSHHNLIFDICKFEKTIRETFFGGSEVGRSIPESTLPKLDD